VPSSTAVNWAANLTNGLYGAVIGGLVAALTAWGVFMATKRLEQQRTTELEARDATRSLILESRLLATSILDNWDEATVLRVRGEQLRLRIMFAAYVPAIASVDLGFASKLDSLIDDLYQRIDRIPADRTSEEGQARVAEVGDAFGRFVLALSGWLAKRRPVVSTRSAS